MVMRSAYIEHERVQKLTIGPSRTKQAMGEESDINIIMAKYEKTGIINHVAKHGPRYADMPDQTEFSEAMNLVTDAQSMFEDLPAGLRSRFHNNPAEFLEFMSDEEKNLEEMRELGLIVPETIPEADPPVVEGDTPIPATDASPDAAERQPAAT